MNLAHADADATRSTFPRGTRSPPFALKSGKLAWEAELPDTRGAGGWVVRAGRECVIAYPEFAIPREPVADVLGRAVRVVPREPGAVAAPRSRGRAV